MSNCLQTQFFAAVVPQAGQADLDTRRSTRGIFQRHSCRYIRTILIFAKMKIYAKLVSKGTGTETAALLIYLGKSQTNPLLPDSSRKVFPVALERSRNLLFTHFLSILFLVRNGRGKKEETSKLT